jgi:hypothetical protein
MERSTAYVMYNVFNGKSTYNVGLLEWLHKWL